MGFVLLVLIVVVLAVMLVTSAGAPRDGGVERAAREMRYEQYRRNKR